MFLNTWLPQNFFSLFTLHLELHVLQMKTIILNIR